MPHLGKRAAAGHTWQVMAPRCGFGGWIGSRVGRAREEAPCAYDVEHIQIASFLQSGSAAKPRFFQTGKSSAREGKTLSCREGRAAILDYCGWHILVGIFLSLAWPWNAVVTVA